jgi:hypothetical protein
MHPSRRKGASAEREVAGLLTDLLGHKVVRRYNLGTHEDIGDLVGLPDTCLQVAAWSDLDRAVREKLPELEQQQARSGSTFAAMFCRRRGGRYVVCMTPEQFACLLREALNTPGRQEAA